MELNYLNYYLGGYKNLPLVWYGVRYKLSIATGMMSTSNFFKK